MKALIVPVLLFLVSCSTFYQVDVNSRAVPSNAKTFVIKSGMSNVDVDDFTFQEFSETVSTALVKTGFTPAVGKPDMVVYLSYSISGPQTHTEATSTRKSFNSDEKEVEVDSYTTYYRSVTLTAKDNRNKPIWETKITSDGSSSNFRKVFPLMIAGGMVYFGTNIDEQVSVTVYEEDAQRVRKPASVK